MIVALGLPLKVATIILGCILSSLSSDFKALGPISIPTPPTVALTEFFRIDTVASVHPLPVSRYLISLLCVYPCSLMHIMSMLCSTADAVSSGSCPILFTVLTFMCRYVSAYFQLVKSTINTTPNVAICIFCLHFINFCCLSSIVDFSNTEARAPNSAGRAPFLHARRMMWFIHVVWVWVIVIFQWLFSFSSTEAKLIDEQQ